MSNEDAGRDAASRRASHIADYTLTLRRASKRAEYKNHISSVMLQSCKKGSATERLVAVCLSPPGQLDSIIDPIKAIGELLDAGAQANIRDRKGRSLLLTMCFVNEYEVPAEYAQQLIEYGHANVDDAMDQGAWMGITPLMHCAAANKKQWVRMLLKHGADYTLSVHGLTAMDLAISKRSDDVIPILRKHKAKCVLSSPPATDGDDGFIQLIRDSGNTVVADMLEATFDLMSKTDELDMALEEVVAEGGPDTESALAGINQVRGRCAAECAVRVKAAHPEFDEPGFARKWGVEEDCLEAARKEHGALRVRMTKERARRHGCATCGSQDGLKECPCGTAFYCGKVCQNAHWPCHKAECRRNRKTNAGSGVMGGSAAR